MSRSTQRVLLSHSRPTKNTSRTPACLLASGILKGVSRLDHDPGLARWRRGCGALVLALAASSACTEEVQLGVNHVSSGAGDSGIGGAAGDMQPPPAGAAGTSLAGAGTGGSGSVALDAGPCVPADCGPRTYECGDCADNDGDGRVDAADPQCLGPCDDSEAELFSGLDRNVNTSCRIDCYFDSNSGYDDGCEWAFACDPNGVAPDYPPTGDDRCEYEPDRDCSPELEGQSQQCRDNCLPQVPNGCDCFGCCELPANSGRFVWLGSENLDAAHCELESNEDPSVCRPCTQVPSCNNPCDTCELCVGKPSLPESCGGSLAACPFDWRSCDAQNGLGCLQLEYCITGCCVPLPR